MSQSEQLKLFDISQANLGSDSPETPRLKLDRGALLVLRVIRQQCNENCEARVPRWHLLELTSLSAQEFDIALADLRRCNLVHVTHYIEGRRPGHRRKQNTYRVTAHGIALAERFDPPLSRRPPRSDSTDIIAAIKRMDARPHSPAQVAGRAVVLRQGGNA